MRDDWSSVEVVATIPEGSFVSRWDGYSLISAFMGEEIEVITNQQAS